jgi:hypothetical protein
MIKDQLPGVVSVVTFTVPALTTTLTPAGAGISNFGELIEIAERTPGTTESFVPMVELGTMTTTDPATTLGWFEWREESFQFYGADVTREVRIRYYDSGVRRRVDQSA